MRSKPTAQGASILLLRCEDGDIQVFGHARKFACEFFWFTF
jgi:hypothetical protein